MSLFLSFADHNPRAVQDTRYYLKVVDKPKPKAPPAKAKAKAAKPAPPAEKKPVEENPQQKLSELELARQKKDAAKPDRTVSPDDKEKMP